MPVTRRVETENYRYFLRAAVLVGVLAGAALGAINLTWIAAWGFADATPRWEWWPALIQAHGNAQLFGWTGLFVIGIVLHSLPRMLQRPAPAACLPRVIFGLILGGLVVGLLAQPLAARTYLAPLFPAAMASQWLGVMLFAVHVLRAIRWPREPWAGFVAAGTLWFAIGATARLALSLVAVARGELVPPAAANAAYLHAMSWGFLLSYVLGYSQRLLPSFAGLPAPSPRAAWAALSLLTVGSAAEVTARLAGSAPLSVAAVGATALGVATAIRALRVWSRALPTTDAGAGWLARFARAAYAWLAAAAVLLLGLRLAEAGGAVSPLHAHAFGGASRHALTVGFVSLMIVGVAWRILPLFSGAPRAHPALVPLVFGLLLTGNTLRVWGQVAAGIWGGGWYALMGVSGWLELAAVSLFAVDVLRLLRGAPAQEGLPDVGPPVALSLASAVGPLVAHRPWLIPVFAQHGMGQVSSPLFQRTVGQRVTVDQACQRFHVEPRAFLAEMLAVEEEKEKS